MGSFLLAFKIIQPERVSVINCLTLGFDPPFFLHHNIETRLLMFLKLLVYPSYGL